MDSEVRGSIQRGLIVSCQAQPGSPLHGPTFMAAMARAAELGGAVALRANGPEDVRALKEVSTLPVIGLWKLEVAGFEPYITPTLESARALAEAGADLIALDATHRPHPEGKEFLSRVKAALKRPIFADVATVEEGVKADEAGASYVSTTLAGYTSYTTQTDGPDFDLLRELANALDIPVIAEGRFWTPEEVERAFLLGAHAVVIGTAITNPKAIAQRFVAAIPENL